MIIMMNIMMNIKVLKNIILLFTSLLRFLVDHGVHVNQQNKVRKIIIIFIIIIMRMIMRTVEGRELHLSFISSHLTLV